MKVFWVFMERMTKWHDDMYDAAWSQYPLNLPHDIVWTLYVLKNSVALNTLELIARKRETMCIRHNVDAEYWKQVEIHVTIHDGTRSTDVEVPSPKGGIDHFPGVHYE